MTAALAPPAPRPLAAVTALTGGGYRRRFELSAAPGSCLLQRVRTRIRYVEGRTLVAELRQTYWEFFRFPADPEATVVDTHDFSVRRDGWRQAAIRALVRRHGGSPDAAVRGGAPVLTVTKSFLLAAGTVTGESAQPVDGGTEFGFLTTGDRGERSRTSLLVATDDPTAPHHVDLEPCPPGYPVAGTGHFTVSAGHAATERFRYHFASLAGRCRDRAGYRATSIAQR